MDYYNLLGVKPTAHVDEIRMAFRRLAKRAHPDAHPHLSGPERDVMHRRFIQLAHAYQTLTDPTLRAEYDRKRRGSRARTAADSRPTSGRGARAAPRSTRPPPPPPEDDAELDELMQEVQKLLGKFGLDMHQHFSGMMDKMLDWALSVFLEVVQALEAAGGRPAQDETRGRGGRAEGGAESAEPSATQAKDESVRPARHTGAAQPDLDAELAALKRQVRATRGKAPGHSPSSQTVEEALRQIKDRKKT